MLVFKQVFTFLKVCCSIAVPFCQNFFSRENGAQDENLPPINENGRKSSTILARLKKRFYVRNLRIFVISWCLSLASLSSLVYCLWVRPEAYPRVEHPKSSSLGLAPVLPAEIRLDGKSLPGTNTLAYYEHP
jgi:hypothetical protein